MALPSSGPLSFSQIEAVTGVGTPSSLRAMSAVAGFSTPDSVSEFYGYNPSYELQISCNGTTSASACGLTTNCIAYSAVTVPVFGTVFYASSAMTTLYDFSGYTNIFIKVLSWDNISGFYRCRIDTTTSTVNNTPVSC